MKMLALLGNPTTTGGHVLTASSSMTDEGVFLVLSGDIASCPKCSKGRGPIVGSAYIWGENGRDGVQSGDVVVCGCPYGANRVIAQSTLFIGNESEGDYAGTNHLAATTGMSTSHSAVPTPAVFDRQIQLQDFETGDVLAHQRYRATTSQGVFKGHTNAEGLTDLIQTGEREEEIQIEVLRYW